MIPAGMAFPVIINAPIPVTEHDELVGISPKADLKPGTESIVTWSSCPRLTIDQVKVRGSSIQIWATLDVGPGNVPETIKYRAAPVGNRRKGGIITVVWGLVINSEISRKEFSSSRLTSVDYLEYEKWSSATEKQVTIVPSHCCICGRLHEKWSVGFVEYGGANESLTWSHSMGLAAMGNRDPVL